MAEKQTQLQVLASELVTPEREFAPRTPHTYAHTGAQVLRRFNLVPNHQPAEPLGSNMPELPGATVYYFPSK